MTDRKYVALSLKHSNNKIKTIHDCCFWGKRTKDEESRNFSGYIQDLDRCELYSKEEFFNEYKGDIYCACDSFTQDSLKRLHKEYDTVLLPLEEVKKYFRIIEEGMTDFEKFFSEIEWKGWTETEKNLIKMGWEGCKHVYGLD